MIRQKENDNLDSGLSNSADQRFTSYDRSQTTGIDYAVNRSYSSGQGRFTSVDPLGASASNVGMPQSLNLYAYTQNNPIDFVDPRGLDIWIVEVEAEPDFWEWFDSLFPSKNVTYRGYLPLPEFGGGGGGGTNGPLTEENKTKVTSAVDSLKNLNPSEDCKKNVIDKLASLGFKLEDFKKYLEKGFNAYEITTSTVSVVGSLFTEEQAKARGLTSANTISDTYKDKDTGQKTADGKSILSRTTAVTSISADTFTVYLDQRYLGDANKNSAWMFHEALHGYLTNGRTDPDLQRAFGLSETASVNISDYIKQHCFSGDSK